MNLRSGRPAETNETKSSPDPKEPHVFQEVAAGHGGVCVLCSRGKSDPRHISVQDNESPRWGF